MEEPPIRVVRITRDESEADDWHLALLAEEVPHALTRVDDRFAVVVDEPAADYARSLLDEYDRERIEHAPGASAATGDDEGPRSTLGITTAVALSAFHLLVAWTPERGWLDAGAGSARAILHGEPWRLITSLTLHADPMHLIGNALACVVLLGALARALGPGVAGALVLASGIAGNLVDAIVRPPTHATIGASTAVFGAVGLLAMLALFRRRRAGLRGMRGYAPLAGGLALFGMLGTEGKNTDVLAHLFGLLAGVVLGLPAILALRAPRVDRRRALQYTLLAVSALGVLGAWVLALRAAG